MPPAYTIGHGTCLGPAGSIASYLMGAQWGEAPQAGLPGGGKGTMDHPTSRPGGRMARILAPAVLALACLPVFGDGDKAPSVEILEPAQGRPVAGDVLLRAKPEAGGAALEREVFRVDGRLVGFRTEPPWEITWDAGLDYHALLLEVSAIDVEGLTASAQREIRPSSCASMSPCWTPPCRRST